MKKGKAAKKAAIAVVTAVAVGGVSVGGYYGIRQAQKTTVKVYPVSDFTSGKLQTVIHNLYKWGYMNCCKVHIPLFFCF